jgi:hypothetical protein
MHMKFQSWVTMSNCVANDFHGHMISLMARADLQNDDESSDDALFGLVQCSQGFYHSRILAFLS